MSRWREPPGSIPNEPLRDIDAGGIWEISRWREPPEPSICAGMSPGRGDGTSRVCAAPAGAGKTFHSSPVAGATG